MPPETPTRKPKAFPVDNASKGVTGMGMVHRLTTLAMAACAVLSGCAVPSLAPLAPVRHAALAVTAKALSLPELSGSHGLVEAPDGTLLIADTYNGSGAIYRIGQDRKPARIPMDRPMSQPAGLRFDRQGRLYVTDLQEGTIRRFGTNGRSDVVAKGLNGPWNLAFTPSGDMVVACADGTIWQYNGDSRKRLHQAKGENPFDVEVDRQGAIYVSLQGRHDPGEQPTKATGRVIRLDPNGQVTTLAAGLLIPEGMAFGPDGTLHVADTAKGCVYELTGPGQKRVVAASLDTPVHLAWHDGQLWTFLAAGRLSPVPVANR